MNLIYHIASIGTEKTLKAERAPAAENGYGKLDAAKKAKSE